MGRMNYKALVPLALAAVIAFARPVAFIAQEVGKAADILAATRKAIGDKKLDALKTFSLQSSLQRNVQTMQVSSDVEILLDLPDKYLRSEVSGGGGGGGMVMVAGGGVTGFNGDRPLQKLNGGNMAGPGGMVIRMGGPAGSFSSGNGDKPSAEQLEQMNKTMVRNSQTEASRLMLGWFAMAHPSINAQYTFAGEAESPDGKAYVIDVKSADNFAARLFIDEQTHLPLMVTYKGPQPRMMSAGGGSRQVMPMGGGGHTVTMTAGMSDDEKKKAQAEIDKQIQEMQKQPPVLVDFTVFFDEWRDADGVKFPFKMRRAMGSETTEEWTVSKVKVNPKIDPKRFAGDS